MKSGVPMRQNESLLHAVPVELCAVDVVHDEPWEPALAVASVQQTRDVRAIEVRQRLPFAAEQSASPDASRVPGSAKVAAAMVEPAKQRTEIAESMGDDVLHAIRGLKMAIHHQQS